ncbi:MAG TPA: PH domain-containing protein, partial [Mycobacterium sp.]
MTSTSFDPTDMNLSSQTVLWEGSSSDLTSMATVGRVTAAGYRVTEDAIYFASGILSTKEESVPLWAVRDIDLNQGMTQRARGVGDLTLKLDLQAAADYGQHVLVLKAIRDPKNVR